MPQCRGWGRHGRSLGVSVGRLAVNVAVLLLVCAPAGAQTLTEAFAYAYNNSPQLLAQRAALRATDEGVPQALANWRPTVNFTGSAGYSRSGFEAPGSNTKAAVAEALENGVAFPCNGPI